MTRSFRRSTKRNGSALLYRDLLGAGLAGMWSVDALIAEIGNRIDRLIAASRLLTDRAYRVDQLREWLVSGQAYGALTDEDIRNPFERPAAAVFHPVRGDAADARSAPRAALGSIIVSEDDIRGAREATPQSAAGSLADQLNLISRANFT